MDDAHHTVTVGLLHGMGVSIEKLSALGRQFIADVIEPLAEAAQRE